MYTKQDIPNDAFRGMSEAEFMALQTPGWNKTTFAAEDTFMLADDGSLKINFNNPDEFVKGFVLSEILPRRRCPLDRFNKRQ